MISPDIQEKDTMRMRIDRYNDCHPIVTHLSPIGLCGSIASID